MTAARDTPAVGILGGGQLARMLGLAGWPLGLRLRAYDPSPAACAGDLMALATGSFEDVGRIREFARGLDVISLDFENVPAASLDALAGEVPVRPGPLALSTAQDRLVEKDCFSRLGIPVTAYRDITDRASLGAAIEQLGLPAVLKTRRFGYDGKGQFRLHRREEADAAWAALGAQVQDSGLILEAFVAFRRELSIIAVRGVDGSFATWPLTENWHVDGVLSASLAPATVSPALAEQAGAYVRRLAEGLDYVGVLALELFDCGDRLLANEMAPRVHNSGHWTIEGAQTSQFENHLRAVLGWPLGDTGALGATCMLNVLGELPDPAALLALPGAHWHDYGKAPRPGRKLAHLTWHAPDGVTLMDWLSQAGRVLQREAELAPVLQRLREGVAGDPE